MSLSKSTALSLTGQKNLMLGSEQHLQKMQSYELMLRDKKHDSGETEKNILNNKDSP